MVFEIWIAPGTWQQKETNLVGGWTNPSEKICSSNWDHFPKVRGENKKSLKPPPSSLLFLWISPQFFTSLEIFKVFENVRIVPGTWQQKETNYHPNTTKNTTQYPYHPWDWYILCTKNILPIAWMFVSKLGSMYGIFTYVSLKFMVKVGKKILHTWILMFWKQVEIQLLVLP